MDIYSIDYVCEENKNVWTGKEIARAESIVDATDKFIKRWDKEYLKGEAEIPISSVKKLTVEKICREKDLIL